MRKPVATESNAANARFVQEGQTNWHRFHIDDDSAFKEKTQISVSSSRLSPSIIFISLNIILYKCPPISTPDNKDGKIEIAIMIWKGIGYNINIPTTNTSMAPKNPTAIIAYNLVPFKSSRRLGGNKIDRRIIIAIINGVMIIIVTNTPSRDGGIKSKFGVTIITFAALSLVKINTSIVVSEIDVKHKVTTSTWVGKRKIRKIVSVVNY